MFKQSKNVRHEMIFENDDYSGTIIKITIQAPPRFLDHLIRANQKAVLELGNQNTLDDYKE